VATLRFSRRAEADLLEIAGYTLSIWGEAQADHYIREMESGCQRLAKHPDLGRPYDEIRPGLRRIEHGKHVVFYRHNATGILVCRILHQRMLPGRRTIETDEEP
jgi:toxin ParE1/3/4